MNRLARPELAPLVEALVQRLGDGDEPTTITVRDLTERSRASLADLLGLDRMPPATSRVRVDRLLSALDLRSITDLRASVEALRGPLPDRRAGRQAEQAAREGLWSWFEAETITLDPDGRHRLAPWVDRVRAQGVRGGIDVHRHRLEQALRVLRALPADGVPLAALAADVLGDPHALDRGRRLAALVLDAVAMTAGLAPAGDAEAARELWERVGVAPDPLSSTVLVLGLRGSGDGPLGPWLDATCAMSEPVVLTLAQLRRWPLPPLPATGSAYVVENPSLVAEAASAGWSGPPLVCSSGRPTVAVVTLLRQLGSGGAPLYQHADFDPAGLSITAWLADRAGTIPWRMTAADYLAAAGPAEGPASWSVPETPWDPSLREAMMGVGRVVYEEQLRADLLAAMRPPMRSG